MTASGPKQRKNNVRSHVGNWEISGRLMLTPGFVESDPKRRMTDGEGMSALPG
jgi:hypothetical protein